MRQLLRRALRRLGAAAVWRTNTSPPRPLLLVVEGVHDVEFMRRISSILHRDDLALPDLGREETSGRLIFLPAGGGSIGTWALKLWQLGLPQFHLYDREMSPATEVRRYLVNAINARPGCRAVLTTKRGLENYLHADAIVESSGVFVRVTDEDSIADRIAYEQHRRKPENTPWEQLTPRARKRCRERVKRWLNTRAVDCMTAMRLSERDPAGEVRSWLTTIGFLLASD